MRARSSRRSSITAATRSIAAARSNAERAAHAGAARFAASIARPASPRVPSATVPTTSPAPGAGMRVLLERLAATGTLDDVAKRLVAGSPDGSPAREQVIEMLPEGATSQWRS